MSRSFGRGFFARLRRSAALPGVAPISEFESLFLNECARVERNGQSLSLLVYTPTSTDPAERAALVEVLRSRLRPTDAIGELDPERLAVLLPETSHEGAWAVAEDLLALLAKGRLKVRCEVFCHPFTPSKTDRSDGHADADRVNEPSKRPDTRPLVLAVGAARQTHGRAGPVSSSPSHGTHAVRGPGAAVPSATQHESFARASRASRSEQTPSAVLRSVAVFPARGGAQAAATRSAVLSRIESSDSEPDADPSANFSRLRLDTRVDEEFQTAVRAPAAGLRAVRGALGARPVQSLEALFVAPLPLWKRAIDIGVCAVLLPLLAPILGAAALAVRVTSPGPVIFRQRRAGCGGKPFTIYKFRSMYIDAEARRLALEAQNEASGPVFKIRADPRITPVGRFLRQSSIDELPQLWNVLKGDMTLVGPRPPMLSEIENYQRWQKGRLNLTGGITCIWQVSGRSEIGFIDWVRMDLRYARQRGFLMDLSLLARTFSAVFSRRGAY